MNLWKTIILCAVLIFFSKKGFLTPTPPKMLFNGTEMQRIYQISTKKNYLIISEEKSKVALNGLKHKINTTCFFAFRGGGYSPKLRPKPKRF